MIPILSKLMGKAKKLAAPRPNPATFISGVTPGVRAEPLVLIVAPSRELATQIFDEARRFCYRTMLRPCVIYGGGPFREQITQLEKGCDVLVGTPGRLCDFINRPALLTLRRLKYIVIDEADEMLASDWEQELKQIMSGGGEFAPSSPVSPTIPVFLPSQCHHPILLHNFSLIDRKTDQEEGNIKYLMFSATFPKIARELATQHLAHNHVRIHVGRAGSSHTNITQTIVFVEPSQKRKALMDLLMSSMSIHCPKEPENSSSRTSFTRAIANPSLQFHRLAPSSLSTASVLLTRLTTSCSTLACLALRSTVIVLNVSVRTAFVPSALANVRS